MSNLPSQETTEKVLAVLTVIVCLKFFVIIIGSGGKRKRAPEDGFQPPNIKKAYSSADPSAPLLDEAARSKDNSNNATDNGSDNNDNDSLAKVPVFTDEERWARIVQNDLENIPITITLMWVAYIVKGDQLTNIILASLFVFGRIMHSVCTLFIQ